MGKLTKQERTSLLCVKSLITILVIITLCALTVIDFLRGTHEFKSLFEILATSVITFYFSHQTDKKQEVDDNERTI